MRPVFLMLTMMVFCFEAHADEANKTAAPKKAPAFKIHSSRAPGEISRFQRQVIVTDKADKNPHASAASQYFDDVMDHLETLMADQIAKNNEIASLQEKIPGYKF